MSRCHYLWLIFLVVLQCAAIFDRRNDFEKGMAYYQERNTEKAIYYFEEYYSEHPVSDTTLYYLHDCYRKQGNKKGQIRVLEQLAKLAIVDIQVYATLLHYYHVNTRFDKFFDLYQNTPDVFIERLDSQYHLTRKQYAQLIVGAARVASSYKDPLGYAIMHGYLSLLPDGMYYENDIMTMGNLIIALDSRLEPTYPNRFYEAIHISQHSYLYLPYMRLVNAGILRYAKNIDPNIPAPVSTAVNALSIMAKRGHLD